MGRSEERSGASRRRTRLMAAVLVPLAVLVAVIGAVVARRGDGDGERGRQQMLIDAAGPSVCRMEELVAAGALAEASNLFWDEVHTGAHVLAAWLGEAGQREAQARFLVAKGAVETAVAVLSPELSRVVPRYAAAHRAALAILGRPATADCG